MEGFMDPVTIGLILGGACCCLSVFAILGGGAFWFLRQKKGDGDASAGALDAMSSMADAAKSVGADAVAAAQHATSTSPDADKRARLAKVVGAQQAAEISDLEHVKVLDGSGMTLIRQSGDAYLMEDPDHGHRLWLWRPADGGSALRADQWTDDWGPIPPGDYDTFCDHWCDQQDAESLDVDHFDEVLAKLGYPNVGSWHRAYWTAVKHFGRSPGPDAQLCSYDINDMTMNGLMPARMRQQARKAQANAAADSSLLAPIEGVTVEVYAACAAAAAQGLSQDQFTLLLAENGLDQVKWERVNAEWTDRMSNDTTMSIMQIYGNAFQNAGKGQFGAAGQAAAATRTAAPGGGGPAGGDEPVPFERLCEINGAMSAWATTGQDINAMLKEVFGITAMDWSNMSSWWISKMATDWERMKLYTDTSEEYETQYKAAVGVTDEDPDADIQF